LCKLDFCQTPERFHPEIFEQHQPCK
jgi:hypothetical protein